MMKRLKKEKEKKKKREIKRGDEGMRPKDQIFARFLV